MKSHQLYLRRFSKFFLLLLVPILLAAGKIISSAVIDWGKVTAVKSHTGWSRNLYKGPTRFLDMLEIQALTLYPGKATHTYLIDHQNDELYFVKEGVAEVSVNNVSRRLNEGNIAVVSQGNRVTISNKSSSDMVYYSVRLKPKYVKPAGKSAKKEKTFFAGADTVKPEITTVGGIRHIYNRTTSSLHNLDVHSIILKTDFNGIELKTRSEEEIILIKKGFIFGSLTGKPFRVGQGSLLFLTNEEPFEVSNGTEGECEYYVVRWLAWSQESKK
jgi:mannose-6-phosphate isomerase-like protein (cupin superfamily)